jgi:uncharacterized damage-inducible protein DinB
MSVADVMIVKYNRMVVRQEVFGRTVLVGERSSGYPSLTALRFDFLSDHPRSPMLTTHFFDVFRHMEWADARIWSAVRQSEKASRDTYIVDSFFHQHTTQHSFLNAWLGRPFVRWNREDFPTVGAIQIWGQEFYEEVPGFLLGVEEEDLMMPSVLPWARFMARVLGHDPEETTLMETLQQLPSHAMHHRGQIMRRMRELDIKPPTADYILWVWQGRPEPEWPG